MYPMLTYDHRTERSERNTLFNNSAEIILMIKMFWERKIAVDRQRMANFKYTFNGMGFNRKVKSLQSNPQCFYSNQQNAEGATESEREEKC